MDVDQQHEPLLVPRARTMEEESLAHYVNILLHDVASAARIQALPMHMEQLGDNNGGPDHPAARFQGGEPASGALSMGAGGG